MADVVVLFVSVPLAGVFQLTPAPELSLATVAVMFSVVPVPIVCGALGVSWTA